MSDILVDLIYVGVGISFLLGWIGYSKICERL